MSDNKVMVCGVDCHKGDANCNGYCEGKSSTPPENHQKSPEPRYTEGFDMDGVVILKDGVPMTIAEILAELNGVR